MTNIDSELVQPLYQKLSNLGYVKAKDPEFTATLREALARVSPSIVDALLQHTSWRHQLVGAWIAGVKGWTEFRDPIGQLLCRPGLSMRFRLAGFSYALASFADAKSIWFLETYLTASHEGHIDNGWALGALLWVDKMLGTRHSERFMKADVRGKGRRGHSQGLVYRDLMRNAITYTSLVCGSPERAPGSIMDSAPLAGPSATGSLRSGGRFPMLAVSHCNSRYRRREPDPGPSSSTRIPQNQRLR